MRKHARRPGRITFPCGFGRQFKQRARAWRGHDLCLLAGLERPDDGADDDRSEEDQVADGPADRHDLDLVVHLGMSGQVLLRSRGADDGPLTRIRFEIVHPEHGELLVNFVDQRIFGSMALDVLEVTPDGAAGGFGSPLALVPRQVAHIARDPLDPAFDDAAFIAALAGLVPAAASPRLAILDTRITRSLQVDERVLLQFAGVPLLVPLFLRSMRNTCPPRSAK